MSRPTYYPKPSLDSVQLMTILRQCVAPYVPLALQQTRITADDLWYVLAYASVQRSSIEAACTELADAPSGNRVREVLAAALPTASVLQRTLNTVLRRQLPKALFKGNRRYLVALDCTLIPYHGQTTADDPEILRAQAKAGTHHFHGYATVSIVHNRRRYIVALRLVRPGESMVQIVRPLLDRLRQLQLPIRRVYMDKEFYSFEVLQTLDRRKLAYVLPLPMRDALQKLCRGRTSHYTTYTLRSPAHGAYRLRIALVYRQRRSPQQRHVVHWFGFAVAGLSPRLPPRQVFQLYRHRFGIETSYRQMNQVRARTSSRSAVLRLLLMGLALILVNLYVSLRTRLGTPVRSQRGGHARPLTLSRLGRLVARAIETYFDIRPATLLRTVKGIS